MELTDGVAARVLDHVGVGYLLVDAEGTVREANAVAETLLAAPDLLGADVAALPSGLGELLATAGDGPTTASLEPAASDGAAVEATLVDTDGDRLIVLRCPGELPDRERRVARYERILDAMGAGVYVLDAEGRYVTVNDYVEEVTGYDREHFVGHRAGRHYGEADQRAFVTAIHELLDEDDPGVKTVEATFERADGEPIVVEANLTLLTDAAGEFRGTVGVVRDVTERKARQQELERFETLLEIMPDTVAVTDIDGTLVELHGFEGWAGYAEEELVGEPISKTATDEDVARGEAIVRELLGADDREKATYQMDVVTKGGERIPHENHLALLPPDEDGRVPGTMSVLRDVSDRVARERALEALSGATRELVAADSRGAIVEKAVETAREVLDLPLTAVFLHDEAEGALVPAAYPAADPLPDEPPTFRPGASVAWEAFEAGEPRVYDDLQAAEGVHNPDTAIRSEIVVPLGEHGVLVSGSTASAVFDEEHRNLAGILGAAVATAFDRLEREREQEAQRRELRRKNARLEEFASVVSHDLRNPLNVAQARVRMAMQAGSDEGLEAADAALDRTMERIDELLTLAREGASVGQLESVDLADVASSAWASVESPDATLSVAVDRVVEADPDRLQELFENLFRNAVEHAGPAVTVDVGSLETGEGFYVEDDGPGIDAADRDAVFERGVSGDTDGTGLGLAIVDDIVAAHGWAVRATEAGGGGARFEVATGDRGAAGDAPSP